MSEQPSAIDEKTARAITDLAQGRLSSLAAWWLRRRITRHPELIQELSETESLYTDLRSLAATSPERATPHWPIDTPEPKRSLSFPFLEVYR